MKYLQWLGVFTLVCSITVQAEELVIYNWSDYFADDTISNFEKETGIKVRLYEFDTNEQLEADLRSGDIQYDLVFPSDTFFARLMREQLFQPLNKRLLPNYYLNLDRNFLASMQADLDPGNRFGLPYLWGTTGIAYNKKKVQQLLGKNFEFTSWKQLFDVNILRKLKGCGVNLLDSSDELIPHALAALGKRITSVKKADMDAAMKLIKRVNPYVQYNSDDFNFKLTDGDYCVTMAWSGDAYEAFYELDDYSDYTYVVPQEGAVLWIDMMAIPANANNPKGAHTFLNYLLESEVSAAVVNAVAYPSAVKGAVTFIDPELLENEGVFPTTEQRKSLVIPDVDTVETVRYKLEQWKRLRGPDWAE